MGRFRQEYHAIATPNPTVPRSRVPSVKNARPEIPPIPCHYLQSVRPTIVTAAIEPSIEGTLHSFINLWRPSKVSNTQRALYKVYITAKGRPFDQLQGRQTIDHTSKGSPVRAFFLLQGLRRARRPLKAVETSLLSCPRHCSQQVRAFALPLHLVHLNLNEGLQLPLEVPACAP